MNIDNLHDALGLLDDDLIEEVDVLRSGRKQCDMVQNVKKMTRWGRLVACVGVFLVGAVTVSFLWMNGFGNTKKSATSDTATKEEVVDEADNTSDDLKDFYTSENTSVGRGDDEELTYKMKVKITSIQSECFEGIVKASTDTKQYEVGTKITIIAPCKIEFSQGTVVVVQFTQQTNTEIVSDHDAELSENVIYATSVTLDESE